MDEVPEAAAPQPADPDASGPPSTEDSPERRRDFRVARMLGAEIEQDGQVTKARLFIVNISQSGLRATYAQSLPEGPPLTLSLFLDPKEEPIRVTGQVVWTKELPASGTFDHGFQFSDMAESDWQRLTDFLAHEKAKAEPKKTLDLSSPWTFGRVN